MRAIDDTTVKLAVEQQQVVADYWSDVEGNPARGVTDFRTEDCLLFVGAAAAWGASLHV